MMKHVFAPVIVRASALTVMGSFPGCQAVAENKQPASYELRCPHHV